MKKKLPASTNSGFSAEDLKTVLFLFPSVLRIEILALFGLLCSVVVASIFSVRFYLPSWGTAAFIWNHYLGALVPALCITWLVVLLAKREVLSFKNHLVYSCRQIIAFLFILYLHFNFKLWAQLINPRLFDEAYQRIDNYFYPIVELANRYSFWANQFIPDGMNAYHELFVAMFAFSYLAHSLTGRWRELESVLLSTAIVLLVGSMCYAIAPAIGPFIYGFGQGVTESVQQSMLTFYRAFVDSAGVRYDETKFVAAIAAMPSLHVANAFVFTYFSWRYIPVLGLPFTLLTLFFACEAVTLRWHYLIDIPFGILVAVAAIWVAERTFTSDKKSVGSSLIRQGEI